MSKKQPKTVWQNHHISYTPEIIIRIRRSVHYYVTSLNRFSGFTANEKKALRVVIRRKKILKEKDVE